MKSIFSKAIKTILVGAVFFMSSCLEDKGYLDIYNGENKDIPVVSFGQADFGQAVRSVAVVDNLQPVSVNVNVARANSDVTANVSIDMDVLNAWNAAHIAAEDYELLPDSTYNIVSSSINIPKGQMDAQYTIQVISTKIDLNHQYALPLRITSATEGYTIASNLSTTMLAVGVKNDYDGIYEVLVTGSEPGIVSTITRNSATGPDLTLGGNYNAGIEIPVITKSKYSNNFQPTWKDGSAVGGIDGTFLTVDPSDNSVVVKSAANPVLKNTPGEPNYYDPETRTFYLSFDWGVAPNTRIVKFAIRWVRERD
jgi:hypothetical protein